MRSSILLTLLVFIFSLIACSDVDSSEKTNSNKSEKAAEAAVVYFEHIGDKDLKYMFSNNAYFRALLIHVRELFPKEDLEKAVETYFQSLKKAAEENPESVWKEWPKKLDGTEINIVGYQRTENIYTSPPRICAADAKTCNDIPARQFPEISKEAYKVSLQFTFTKTSSAMIKDGIFLKKVIFEVPVYYDGKQYLIDFPNVRHLPVGDELWIE